MKWQVPVGKIDMPGCDKEVYFECVHLAQADRDMYIVQLSFYVPALAVCMTIIFQQFTMTWQIAMTFALLCRCSGIADSHWHDFRGVTHCITACGMGLTTSCIEGHA